MPTDFKVEVREESVRGFLKSRCAYITVGSTRFSFRVPEFTRVNTGLYGKLVVFNDDYSCSISVRLAPEGFKSADVGILREKLMNLYTDAAILGERAMFVGSKNGPAFDLIHSIDGVKRKTRIGFVPSAAGILEINLTCSPELFDKHETTLNQLLGTFRASEPDGSLEVVRLSVDN